RRDVMIPSPLTMMKHAAKTSVAPMTARGRTARAALNLGISASTRNIPPITYASTRLVTPVAVVKPTLEAAEFIGTVPSRPPQMLPRPSARTPPMIDLIDGRVHSLSLIRWHVVTLPITFRHPAVAATAKGATRARSNDHRRCPIRGTEKSGAL